MHSHRINKTNDFIRIYKKGKRFRGQFIQIVFLPSVSHRFAYTVSKKTVRLAVRRNRVKRVMKEVLRMSLHNIPLADCVCRPTFDWSKFPRKEQIHGVSKDVSSFLNKHRDSLS